MVFLEVLPWVSQSSASLLSPRRTFKVHWNQQTESGFCLPLGSAKHRPRCRLCFSHWSGTCCWMCYILPAFDSRCQLVRPSLIISQWTFLQRFVDSCGVCYMWGCDLAGLSVCWPQCVDWTWTHFFEEKYVWQDFIWHCFLFASVWPMLSWWCHLQPASICRACGGALSVTRQSRQILSVWLPFKPEMTDVAEC